MVKRYRIKRTSGPTSEPCVRQGEIHGRYVSWNPDDGRFYVEDLDGAYATFARWSNAVAYAKRISQ